MGKRDCGCNWTGDKWEFCFEHLPPQELRAKVKDLELQIRAYEKRIPELCAEYLKKLEEAGRLNEGMKKALEQIVALHAESNGADFSPGMMRLAVAALAVVADKPRCAICNDTGVSMEGGRQVNCTPCALKRKDVCSHPNPTGFVGPCRACGDE